MYNPQNELFTFKIEKCRICFGDYIIFQMR